MNNKIEKFLLWACIFQVLGLVASRIVPGAMIALAVENEMSSGQMTSLIGLFAFACMIPLKLVCGTWLKKEAERMEVNHRIWFWTGFLFNFMGIVVFYVYLMFCRNQKVQPVGGDQ
tara:strand:+ start:65 stop:412 length:348 start_codon:yes stop_codon:yes gene_type:complete